MSLDGKTIQLLLQFQNNEITEFQIYENLAKRVKDPKNQRILRRIAADEKRHYETWRKHTRLHVRPNRFKVFFYTLLARLFGITFGVKLMERGEQGAQAAYAELSKVIPEAAQVQEEENQHEGALLALLDEQALQYVGSIVLGLNDALVELTGALAGFTLALQNTQLIALTGIITGIAAALSMAASEYLATKSEETDKRPLRAATYTGIAYLCTVVILILPYLFLTNYYVCLAVTLAAALSVIVIFNFYISVAQDISFRKRFLEMAGISFGVSAFSFLLGFVVRKFMGIEI